MNYGMPYKGSKNSIAENLIKQLPPAKHFYDLFGGGGAMTHCALLSGKYQFVHYNELDPLVFKGFKMFINGDFKNENRWISREDFNRLKDTDPYVAICFSFGNTARTYRYNRQKELFQKAVHFSICFNDNSLLSEYIDLKDFSYCFTNFKERRLELQKYFTELYKKNKLNDAILKYAMYNGHSIGEISSNNQSLERLNSFNADNTRIILTNQSYSDVQIEPNSVIYCDPPYLGTDLYNSEFNHNEFYEWVRNNSDRVYVSEYHMPDDFFEIYSIEHKAKLNDKGSKKTIEKLFTNKPLENPLEF